MTLRNDRKERMKTRSNTWRISWKNWFRLIRLEKFKENLGEKFFGGGGFYEERGLSWTSYYR